jgi:TRAP-type C4-dicarboxylate transport system permease small subunit
MFKSRVISKDKINKYYLYLEDGFSYYLPGVVIVILMLFMVTDICLRWFFRNSLQGVLEIVEASMVIIAFASLAGIQRDKGHVRMDYIVKKLSKTKINAILEMIGLISSFSISTILIYPLLKYTINLKQFNETSEFLGIPLWLIAIFMPLGFLFLSIRLISQFLTEAKRLLKS